MILDCPKPSPHYSTYSNYLHIHFLIIEQFNIAFLNKSNLKLKTNGKTTICNRWLQNLGRDIRRGLCKLFSNSKIMSLKRNPKRVGKAEIP